MCGGIAKRPDQTTLTGIAFVGSAPRRSLIHDPRRGRSLAAEGIWSEWELTRHHPNRQDNLAKQAVVDPLSRHTPHLGLLEEFLRRAASLAGSTG